LLIFAVGKKSQEEKKSENEKKEERERKEMIRIIN